MKSVDGQECYNCNTCISTFPVSYVFPIFYDTIILYLNFPGALTEAVSLTHEQKQKLQQQILLRSL